MKNVFSLMLLGAWGARSAPPAAQLSRDLAADSQAMVRVLIQSAGPADDSKDRKTLAHGGLVHSRFQSLPMGVYTLSGSALRDLANDPAIRYVSPYRTISPKFDLTGAVLASSFLANPPLLTPALLNATAAQGGPAPDQFGHGQHIAGIIASNRQGSDSTVILAIDTPIALKNIFNIRVINLLLGRPAFESYVRDPLCQAAEAAWNAGKVPAGNAHSPVASYPNTTETVTLSLDPASIWGTQSVWATRSVWDYQSVWGASVLQGSQALWNTNTVWGTNTAWGANSVCGAGSGGGANSLWGANSVWAASTNTVESISIAINGEQ